MTRNLSGNDFSSRERLAQLPLHRLPQILLGLGLAILVVFMVKSCGSTVPEPEKAAPAKSGGATENAATAPTPPSTLDFVGRGGEKANLRYERIYPPPAPPAAPGTGGKTAGK